MPTYTATDYEPVTPGLYIASLQEIKDAQSQHAVYYRWRFVIEHEGRARGPCQGAALTYLALALCIGAGRSLCAPTQHT